MTIRIAAWSGPRNMSTAMMRAWENRPDTSVMDEPLYAASMAVTGIDHPMRSEILAAGPTDFDAAVMACLAPLTDGAEISYQKHMAHHLLDQFDRSWLDDLVHVLLIRNPRRVLASYVKVWDEVTVADIGLPQQIELAERAVLIVDSDEFLTNPKAYLSEMCDRVGVPFDDKMLAWPKGKRDTDGAWAPAWYSAVEESTGFGPPPSSEPAPLRPDLEPVAVEAESLYHQLYSRRYVA